MPAKKTTSAAGKVSAQPEKKAVKPELKSFLDEIKKKAYEIYLKRKEKGQSGDEMSDWIAAEKEIKAKYKI